MSGHLKGLGAGAAILQKSTPPTHTRFGAGSRSPPSLWLREGKARLLVLEVLCKDRVKMLRYGCVRVRMANRARGTWNKPI